MESETKSSLTRVGSAVLKENRNGKQFGECNKSGRLTFIYHLSLFIRYPFLIEANSLLYSYPHYSSS